MTTTYTTNTKLSIPGTGDTGWAVPADANFVQLDAISAIGGLAVTTTEVPSTTLNVKVAAGRFLHIVASGNLTGSVAGNAVAAITEDGTTIAKCFVQLPASSLDAGFYVFAHSISPAADPTTHQYTLIIGPSSGASPGVTLDCASVNPAFLEVNDMGPTF